MGTKSRESIFGPSIRASAERAAAARISVQAQPSGRVADHEKIGERPAFDVVAGGAIVVPAS